MAALQMYEELVRSLRTDHDKYFARDMEAADAIESLIKAYQMMAEAYEREVTKQKWISVTERLPKERINPNTRDFEYVLCVTIWGDVRPFKYGTPIGQKEAHFWNGAGYVDAYVTHWMPLPEPPKEET